MKKPKGHSYNSGISRREFIQYSAAAGASLALPGLFSGCDSGSGHYWAAGTESRHYYFDLSNANPTHRYHLKAATRYYSLLKMDQDALAVARKSNPFLEMIPDGCITHRVTAEVPIGAISLCWIVGEDPAVNDGTWNMPLMFYHIPKAALAAARQRPGADPDPGANKLALYGSFMQREIADVHLLEDDFKTCTDQAAALVGSHHEMLCGEPNSAAHISKNIIAPQPTTFELAVKLQYQGPATEEGGWATLEPYIDENTGDPYLNSKGQKQYFPRWSDETAEATGQAISPSLKQAKNDPTLGANVTGLDPGQDNPQMTGTIWSVRDGISTVDASSDAGRLGAGFDYAFFTYSCLNGYHVKLNSVDSNRNATVEIKNSYLRYLGLYVRYLDANGDPIPVDQLPVETLDTFPNWASKYDSDYDNLAMLIQPELVVLGIPLKADSQKFTINVPPAASCVQVLAGGLGHGVSAFPDIVQKPGIVSTVLMNLAAPAVFLATAAASAYGEFVKDFILSGDIRNLLLLIEDIAFAVIMAANFSDARALTAVGKQAGLFLLQTPWFAKRLDTYLSGAEATDQIPVFGTILQAASALGLIASLAETIAEVCRSPLVYNYRLTFTHDINVTIQHDPEDFEFPATATHYELKALFDNGTPYVSGRIDMPATSQSDPFYYTFSKVPYGGKVKIAVGFFSETDWLAGQGATDNIANDDTAANVTITITENKVPLRIDTVYGHKEKSVLDGDGNLIWEAGDAPTTTKADLSCGNIDGDLCEPSGITISEHFAAAGYSWRSYSGEVALCGSSARGQLFQFANMSIAQDPESGHETSGCGFGGTVRIVYDLMGSQNNNFYLDTTDGGLLVRQIRLGLNQKPDFDGPGSNKCWGVFANPSDAFLLHPARKLVSINSEFDKIEVLDLPEAAVADSEAPAALVYSATGTREGLISGPICAAVAPDGTILVLESDNMRIQAFDIGGNPVKHFGQQKDPYYVPLKTESSPVTYLDMAVEYKGYVYVLSYVTNLGLYTYRLDIYTPQGEWLCRTTGVNAAKLAVDFWRNAYTLNYESLKYPDGTLPAVTEPSVSQWIPSTP